jgi:hypothetical protein
MFGNKIHKTLTSFYIKRLPSNRITVQNILMKKHIVLASLLLAFCTTETIAQYRGKPVTHRDRYRNHPQRTIRSVTHFEPTVNVSFGYGFPNVDQYRMAEFYNAYKGNASQTGPFMAALDYQFSPFMSIGVMATYGKVSAPYYYTDNNDRFTGKLENTALMLNLVNYIPAGSAVSPYIRLAAGANIWQQDYRDEHGLPLDYIVKPSAFAYQASLGAKFNMSERAGLFVEAGYGKYILNGGLAFKF